MCHLDMAAGQRRGVKLGISNIANYNSSLIYYDKPSDTYTLLYNVHCHLNFSKELLYSVKDSAI